MKKLKFNQCQDCGCPGSSVVPILRGDGMMVMVCPFCKRKSVPFKLGFEEPDFDFYEFLVLAIESWNINNRDNKEGLN